MSATVQAHARYTRSFPGLPCASVPLPPGYDGGPCRYVEATGDDALAPVKGIALGLLISTLVWVLILLGVAELTRWF